jgi:hypothetical protein
MSFLLRTILLPNSCPAFCGIFNGIEVESPNNTPFQQHRQLTLLLTLLSFRPDRLLRADRKETGHTQKGQFVQFYPLATFLTALPLPTILQVYGTESDRNDRTANRNTGI